ncbi:uncharacterized protein LOC144916002 [Branchiostoma floridae x Branchiostoma belcheri]
MMAAMLAAGRPAKSLRTCIRVKTSPSHPIRAPLCQRNTGNILKAALGACYAKFLSSDAFSDGRSGPSSYATTGICGGRVPTQVRVGLHDRDRYTAENVYSRLSQDPVVLRTIREFYDCERDVLEEKQDSEALEQDQILKSYVAGGVNFATNSLQSWPFGPSDSTVQPFERSLVRSLWTQSGSQRHQKFYARERRANLHYYDVLGVTPIATQTQIKSAYYKKSMQFHPDRNKTAYAADRFTEITEAYEVLGHVDLRRKYDQGVLNKSDLLKDRKPPSEPTRPETGRQSYSDTRIQSRGNLGYNMDEWLKGHYGEALEQEKRRKRVRKNYEDYQKAAQRNRNDSYIAVALFGIAAVIAFIMK